MLHSQYLFVLSHLLLFYQVNDMYLEIVFSLQVTLDDQKSKAVEFKIIWSSSPDCLKYESYFSLPELIEFPTEVPGQTAFAYFYPPTNPSYQGTQDEKPPLLLKSHGNFKLPKLGDTFCLTSLVILFFKGWQVSLSF